MIEASRFVNELIVQGTTHFTGVPCSYLTPLINEVIAREETQYVLASSEGDAVAIASGLWLGGKTAVVLCQNSGLGNMVNPLTSLSEPSGIPVLMLVTWRGRPGFKDEPQHRLMGQITPGLLSLMGIEWALLPDTPEAAIAAVQQAYAYIRRTHKPFALVLSETSFSAGSGVAADSRRAELPGRADALRTLLENIDEDAIVIATTGKTGRELFTLQDRPQHFYCVGAMGYASAIAHGVALACARQVYLIDGDGAAIMHLGNMTSIGAAHPANLTHIVLDNACHDSTGAQPTASATVDFAAAALAAGYAAAQKLDSLAAFGAALAHAPRSGPRLLHLPIRAGSMDQLGRPTETPYAVARRLRALLGA